MKDVFLRAIAEALFWRKRYDSGFYSDEELLDEIMERVDSVLRSGEAEEIIAAVKEREAERR